MSYISITENNQSFRRKVILGMQASLNKSLARMVGRVRDELRQKMSLVFRADKVYDALSSGPLDAMLGFPAGLGKHHADAIVNAVIENMQVNYTPLKLSGKTLVGGIEIGLLREDFKDLLSLPQSVYTSNGHVIPWLDWLLFRGDQIIIAGYDIEFGDFDNSRSGAAIMIQDKASAWRIPPEYSGVVTNNWLTRTIDNNIQLIETICTHIIAKQIKRSFDVS